MAQSTRDQMLDVALDLFHRKGVHAVSVDEILEASGTGKSQFYHYFQSKDGLIAAVVVHFRGKLSRRELPVQYEVRSFAGLKQWFEGFLQFQRMTGCARFCPMATIASGLEADQEPIRCSIEDIFTEARQVLVEFFDAMGEQGRLSRKSSAVELADFCYAIMQGGLLVSKVRKDVKPFEHAVKHALKHVQHVLKPPK